MAFRRNRTGYEVGDKGKPADQAAAGLPAPRPPRRKERAGDESRDPEESHASRRPRQTAQEAVNSVALKLLAARARTESQLRERLLARPFEARLVDECIVRLKELGYINDRRFAQNYASSRVAAKAMGRSRLARELGRKQISRRVVDEALDRVYQEAGEDELIDRAIEKRIRTHGRPADAAGAKRMFDHLARLGFEYDLIIRRLRVLRRGDEFEL